MRQGMLLAPIAHLALGVLHAQALARGPSTLELPDPVLPTGRTLAVHVHVPKGLRASSPVLFVIHGKNRDALAYREVWTPLANEFDFLLVCPEFSQELFPSSEGFNIGQVQEESGRQAPEERWTFSVVERLFDVVKERAGSTVERYHLYGHSAGGQFVHRLVLLHSAPRIERAVAANAGWYTFPDTAVAFPYGLGGFARADEVVARALGRDLVILLGAEDTDPKDENLRNTPEAVAQGAHRLARGQNFVAEAHERAEALGVPLAWRLETVPGAGHSNAEMARAAAKLLFADSKRRKR